MIDLKKDQIRILKTSSDPEARRSAADFLSGHDSPDSIETLTGALKDSEKLVREMACRSLLTIGGVGVARAVAPLIKDENAEIRSLTAELLYRLGNSSIQIVEPFLHDPSKDVRKLAVDILGLLKHKKAVTAIIPLLYDSDPDVVIAAVESLGNIGDESAIAHLIQVYEQELYARTTVVSALGKIKGQKATDFLSQSFRQSIAEDADPLTLFAIIEALGNIGDHNAFLLLAGHLPAADGKLRRVILGAMMWIADKLELPMEIPGASSEDLLSLLSDSDLRVCLNAMKALANIPGTRVTSGLVDALGTSEYIDVVLFGVLESREDTFSVAVDKLPTAPESIKKQILMILKGLVSRVRVAQSESVSDAKLREFDRGFATIAAEWNSGDERLRQLILDTLFGINSPRAIEMLEELMRDPDPWVRMRTLELLSSIEDNLILEFVSKYADDEDEMVRSTAEWLLESKGLATGSENGTV